MWHHWPFKMDWVVRSQIHAECRRICPLFHLWSLRPHVSASSELGLRDQQNQMQSATKAFVSLVSLRSFLNTVTFNSNFFVEFLLVCRWGKGGLDLAQPEKVACSPCASVPPILFPTHQIITLCSDIQWKERYFFCISFNSSWGWFCHDDRKVEDFFLMLWFWINMSGLSRSATWLTSASLFDELGVRRCWLGFILPFSDVNAWLQLGVEESGVLSTALDSLLRVVLLDCDLIDCTVLMSNADFNNNKNDCSFLCAHIWAGISFPLGPAQATVINAQQRWQDSQIICVKLWLNPCIVTSLRPDESDTNSRFFQQRNSKIVVPQSCKNTGLQVRDAV